MCGSDSNLYRNICEMKKANCGKHVHQVCSEYWVITITTGQRPAEFEAQNIMIEAQPSYIREMRRVITVTAGDELEIFLFLMMGRSLGSLGSLGRLTTGNRPIKPGRVPVASQLLLSSAWNVESNNFPLRHLDNFHSSVPGPRSHRVPPCHTVPGLRLNLSLLIFTFVTALARHLSEYLEISAHMKGHRKYLPPSCSVLISFLAYNQETGQDRERDTVTVSVRAEFCLLSGNN